MRWRLAVALAAWAMVAVACGAAGETTTTTGTAPAPPAPSASTSPPTLAALTTTTAAPVFQAPVFEPPDEGIAFVTPVDSLRLENDFEGRATAFSALVDDGSFQLDDDGIRLELDRCEIVAPNHWLIGGTATVPEGNPLALLGLRFESYNPDLVETTGWYPTTSQDFIVELTRSGAFTLHHDRAAVQRDTPPDQFPMFDVGPVCRIEIAWSLAPLAGPLELEIERTVTSAPLRWDAPDGSVQAIGIGAVLGDPRDTRSEWAYATWGNWALPFPQIAVASVAGVWSPGAARAQRRGACDWVTTTYRHVNQITTGEIIQAIRCDATDVIGQMGEAGDVHGAAGWNYVELSDITDPVGGDEPWLRATTSIGGFDLYAFLPASEAVFVEFLNSFEWLENLVIE